MLMNRPVITVLGLCGRSVFMKVDHFQVSILSKNAIERVEAELAQGLASVSILSKCRKRRQLLFFS